MVVPSMVARQSSSVQRLLMRALMPIRPGWNIRPVAFDLTTDGGVVAAQPTGNLSQAEL